jgi:hypothetical protein
MAIWVRKARTARKRVAHQRVLGRVRREKGIALGLAEFGSNECVSSLNFLLLIVGFLL